MEIWQLGNIVIDVQVQLQCGNSPEFTFSLSNLMESLLQIASRIEAAVLSLQSVKPALNLEEWKWHFNEEKVSTVFDWLCYTLIPI